MFLGPAFLKFTMCRSCQISDSQSSAALLFKLKFLKKKQQGVFLLGQKHREQVLLASKNVTMSRRLVICLSLS
jgi:hypothetical protein